MSLLHCGFVLSWSRSAGMSWKHSSTHFKQNIDHNNRSCFLCPVFHQFGRRFLWLHHYPSLWDQDQFSHSDARWEIPVSLSSFSYSYYHVVAVLLSKYVDWSLVHSLSPLSHNKKALWQTLAAHTHIHSLLSTDNYNLLPWYKKKISITKCQQITAPSHMKRLCKTEKTTCFCCWTKFQDAWGIFPHGFITARHNCYSSTRK